VVWRHKDAYGFTSRTAGPGPRATPTISDGRVYTHGATGIVNALNANTGALLWTRNSSTDTGGRTPGLGIYQLAAGDEGPGDRRASGRLVAYDITTGTPRWSRKTGGGGYSSPHLMAIDGVDQIVLQHGSGAMAVAPADGAVLWQHAWETGVAIVQPVLVGHDAVLIVGGDAMGGRGSAAPRDFLRRRRMACRRTLDLNRAETVLQRPGHPQRPRLRLRQQHPRLHQSRRRRAQVEGWTLRPRQLVLLPDQDLLLVLSEEGDLALVKATPDQFTEVAKFKAIEGKTWNHPALAGDVLLVRNGEEMAAFRLSLAVHDTTR
jgi:outer membrane protein assembly factor BamB